VLAVNGSAAYVERGCKPSVHTERLGPSRGADNVNDGIHRANLVEVNLFDGHGMDGGLGFAQQLEGADRTLLHALGERGGANDFDNRRQRAMPRVGVRMMLMLIMRVVVMTLPMLTAMFAF